MAGIEDRMQKTALFVSLAAIFCTVPAFAQDAGTDAGTLTSDAGSLPADAGPAVVTDSGTPPVVDAGTPAVVDSGAPNTDAGAPANDAGPPSTDAGTPVVDAGDPPVVDAGSPPDPCGGLDFRGECAGNTVRYCSNDEIIELPCSDNTTCGLISDDWGYDCQLADGQSCLISSGDTAFCEDGSGCFDAVCEPNQGHCETSGNFAAVCNGDHLTTSCKETQPVGLVCPANSTCTAGACTGIAEGGVCDNNFLICDTGLNCQGGACSAGGNAGPDGGTTEPDPTPSPEPDDDDDDDDGCSATGVPSSSVPASLALLALLGMGLRRRRR